MPDLSAHQRIFYDNCFEGNNEHSAKFIVPFGIPGEDRLNIYKNNSFISLSEALESTFPTILKLVGKEFFSYSTHDFIKRFPPRPGPLFEYGEYFSEFLQQFAPASSIPYLSDMARLEWTMNIAYYAKDELPITVDELINISEEQLTKLRFRAHPSCQLISSDYPINEIWRANNLTDEFTIINLDQRCELIVFRPQETVIILPIDAGTKQFFTKLMQGRSVEQAFALTVDLAPDFDGVKILVELITAGVFADYILPIN